MVLNATEAFEPLSMSPHCFVKILNSHSSSALPPVISTMAQCLLLRLNGTAGKGGNYTFPENEPDALLFHLVTVSRPHLIHIRHTEFKPVFLHSKDAADKQEGDFIGREGKRQFVSRSRGKI